MAQPLSQKGEPCHMYEGMCWSTCGHVLICMRVCAGLLPALLLECCLTTPDSLRWLAACCAFTLCCMPHLRTRSAQVAGCMLRHAHELIEAAQQGPLAGAAIPPHVLRSISIASVPALEDTPLMRAALGGDRDALGLLSAAGCKHSELLRCARLMACPLWAHGASC